MDAQEFINAFTPLFEGEAQLTETYNDSPDFFDYVADIATLCERLLAQEHPYTEHMPMTIAKGK